MSEAECDDYCNPLAHEGDLEKSCRGFVWSKHSITFPNPKIFKKNIQRDSERVLYNDSILKQGENGIINNLTAN